MTKSSGVFKVFGPVFLGTILGYAITHSVLDCLIGAAGGIFLVCTINALITGDPFYD